MIETVTGFCYSNRMYNKLFTKILDSSIWLAPDPHRIVWITLLAAMDQDGFAQFASVANLAHRARVSVEAAEEAAKAFESPDENSADPSNDGRRIERVPGGWIVLNASKYQVLVTRAINRENTRLRVAAHRKQKRERNEVLRSGNASVTPSYSYSDAYSEPDKNVLPSSSQHQTSSSYSPPEAEKPINGVLEELKAKIARGSSNGR